MTHITTEWTLSVMWCPEWALWYDTHNNWVNIECHVVSGMGPMVWHTSQLSEHWVSCGVLNGPYGMTHIATEWTLSVMWCPEWALWYDTHNNWVNIECHVVSGMGPMVWHTSQLSEHWVSCGVRNGPYGMTHITTEWTLSVMWCPEWALWYDTHNNWVNIECHVVSRMGPMVWHT